MKKLLTILIREQKGQALPIALAMLAVGSLVVVPLLNLTETALRAGIRDESRMYEHYAANAGIMDGIREIIAKNPQLPAVGDNWTYSIPDTNNRSVDVIISTIDSNNWKITSTAISGNGGSTKLDCYLEKKTYLPNAITSTSVTIKSSSIINGNVQWDSTLGTLTNKGTINGEIIDAPAHWPTVEEVSALYLEQVDGAPTIEGDLFLNLGPETIGNPYSLGPIYINGDLTITGDPEGAVRLDGTVFVNGEIDISGVKVYQNNNTMWSETGIGASITIQASAEMKEAGCVVSRRGIDFFGSTSGDTYLVVWSLKGSVNVNTSGEFDGMLYSGEFGTRGNVVADVGQITNYVEPLPDLLLPPLPGRLFRVVGWESTSQ